MEVDEVLERCRVNEKEGNIYSCLYRTRFLGRYCSCWLLLIYVVLKVYTCPWTYISRRKAAFQRFKDEYNILKDRVEAYLEVSLICLKHTHAYRRLLFLVKLMEINKWQSYLFTIILQLLHKARIADLFDPPSTTGGENQNSTGTTASGGRTDPF